MRASVRISLQLTDPLMILKSTSKEGRLVAVLELKDANGVNVIAPFELDTDVNGIQANHMTSAYGKSKKKKQEINYPWYVDQVIKGNVVYWNKEKATSFFASAGVQFPMGSNNRNGFLDSSIKTEDDLVKARIENPTLYQFAGQNARTADTVKLAEAQRMDADGASAEDIYKATGWLKGEDGEWRFEIPDNLDKIDLYDVENGPADTYGQALGRIYDNPALYEAYPWLQEIPVLKSNDLGMSTRA